MSQSHVTRLFGGPGSGKTTALLDRVDGMLDDGVDMRDILVVSYTRAAAQEIRERLAERLDRSPKSLKGNVSTMHAKAYELLNLSPGDVVDEEHKEAFCDDYGIEFEDENERGRRRSAGSAGGGGAKGCGHAVGPGGDDGTGVLGRDATDADERRRHRFRDGAHAVEPDPGLVGCRILRRRAVDSADAEIIRAGIGRFARGLDRRYRPPDDGVVVEALAGDRDRHVVVAEVDAVRLDGACQVDPIVDDQRHAGLTRHRPEFQPEFVPVTGAPSFLPELHDIDAPGDGRLDDVDRRVTPRAVVVGHQIRPQIHPYQPCGAASFGRFESDPPVCRRPRRHVVRTHHTHVRHARTGSRWPTEMTMPRRTPRTRTALKTRRKPTSTSRMRGRSSRKTLAEPLTGDDTLTGDRRCFPAPF